MPVVRYTIFPKKLIHKWNKEIVTLHKRVLDYYLYSIGVSLKNRRNFFKLYDLYIDEENVLQWYYTPVKIFVQGLVKNELDKVSTFIFIKGPTVPIKQRKRKRKTNH